MASSLAQQLNGVRDLKKILETTVLELGQSLQADTCQIMLTNPLDHNSISICEYKSQNALSEEAQKSLADLTIPLSLEGNAFGHVRLTRSQSLSSGEANNITLTMQELGHIIRHAQINENVQRDTFRHTFLIEIGNVMSYSLGIGDALFMVVNILGKVLNVSRCLFICTDDTQAGWKCYEYWQQNKVESCQSFCWPTTDSPTIAQTLLSNLPLLIYEGQSNSHSTPAQEELLFIGAKSLLGIPLKSNESIHGCVILQQCDYRRAWTRSEIDMVQSVADKVAEALLKLPSEKLAREPIMQLHQRIVAPSAEKEAKDIQSVRRALKGVLVQQSIPIARQSGAKSTKPEELVMPKLPATEAEPEVAPDVIPESKEEVAQELAVPETKIEEKEEVQSQWGNLDAIPTPVAGPAVGGLSSLAKGKSSKLMSPLLASFHKDKTKFLQEAAGLADSNGHDSNVADAKQLPQEELESSAKAKVNEIMAHESSNPTSDYIFATPGLSASMAGRIDGWIFQIEEKDKYVNGHAKFVAEYACAIANQMDLPKEEIDTIRLAALVHDVGKLGTSLQLLQKRDQDLTDAELIIMMKHPNDGAELLASFPELEQIAPIVKAHHEEFDGNGYPVGLKNEEIPLSARIIHVADSYHQMTSDLHSRKAMDIELACKELEASAGSQFDPQVVEALMQAIKAKKIPVVCN